MRVFSGNPSPWLAGLAGLVLAVTVSQPAWAQDSHYLVKTDPRTSGRVMEILQTRAALPPELGHGDKLGQLSAAFLGVPYQANTLIGSRDTAEMLVADFNQVDCFTFIDYVEALSRAEDAAAFLARLADVRYAGGTVDYRHRRHFFSDWAAAEPHNAADVTRELGGLYVAVDKVLNRKADGSEYVPGIGTFPRTIDYIPASAINAQVLENLQTGDYVGVYTPREGLDVTHVGIAIRRDGQVWFRNASSVAGVMKVVDAPLQAYMATKPGMVVLRAQ